MRHYISALLLLSANLAHSDTVLLKEEIKCENSGCILKCATEQGNLMHMGIARSVKLKIKYELHTKLYVTISCFFQSNIRSIGRGLLTP